MTVALTEAAEADLAAIHAYYAERSGTVAGRVLGTLLRAINGLAVFPLLCRTGTVPETREHVVTHYPYRIVYHINGGSAPADTSLRPDATSAGYSTSSVSGTK